MPLEGHWKRVNTPVRQLTGRERRIIVAAMALVLATAVVVAVIAASAPVTRTPKGCIDVIVPSIMGGQPVHGCGAGARAICREHLHATDPGSRAIEAGCRRSGIAVAD